MEFDKYYDMALPYLKEVLSDELDLKKIASLVKTRIEVLTDIKDLVDFFAKVPEYDVSMYEHKKMKTNIKGSLEVLKDVLPVIMEIDVFTNDILYQHLLEFADAKDFTPDYSGLKKWICDVAD